VTFRLRCPPDKHPEQGSPHRVDFPEAATGIQAQSIHAHLRKQAADPDDNAIVHPHPSKGAAPQGTAPPRYQYISNLKIKILDLKYEI
jgi:hypothetical protein